MMIKPTIENLIDSAHQDLEQCLLSGGALFILWRSFKDAEHLKRNYLESIGKKSLLDGRRTRKTIDARDADFIDMIDRMVAKAVEHREWLNLNNRQHLLRSILITYCSGVEEFLKRIAIALSLNDNLSHAECFDIKVTDRFYREATKKVLGAWRRYQDEKPSQGQRFFEDFVYNKNPAKEKYRFSLNEKYWDDYNSAFKIRNLVVHGISHAREQIQVGEYTFHCSEKIELDVKHTEFIAYTISKIFDLGPKLHVL